MKIFKAASKKRCWDHFSKAQRRNIDEWHQQVGKVRQTRPTCKDHIHIQPHCTCIFFGFPVERGTLEEEGYKKQCLLTYIAKDNHFC